MSDDTLRISLNGTAELRQLLDFAVALAQDAGRLTLGHFRSGIRPEYKDDSSPVTEADRQAEQLIRNRVHDRYPQHGVLGEEYGEDGNGAEFRWVVDPIDGTKAFVRGVPLYGVLLGLEVAGEIVAGVADFPALGETVWAARGFGTRLNGRRVYVSDRPLDQATVTFGDIGNISLHGRETALKQFSAATAFRAGWSDAYGHALVACGRTEIMLDPVMNPWDCGPFPVILEEAGGYFGDWQGNPGINGGEALSTTATLRDEVLRMAGSRD